MYMRIAALAAGVSAAFGGAVAAEDLTIGVSMRTIQGDYYGQQALAAERLIEAAGNTALVSGAENDVAQQLADIEDMISQGVDGLIINASDPSALCGIIGRAAEAGIPTVTIDSGVIDTCPVASAVASNNFANGALVGEWLVDYMDGEPLRIAWMSSEQGNPVGKDRRDGLLMGIIEASLRERGSIDMEIVAHVYAGGWAFEDGLRGSEDILSANQGNFNVYGVEADHGIIMGHRVMNSLGIEGVPIVSSADGYVEALELINEGMLGAVGLNSPAAVAGLGYETLIAVLAGENVERLRYTPAVAFTPDNIESLWPEIEAQREEGILWPVFE